jgi:hypothetical protein
VTGLRRPKARRKLLDRLRHGDDWTAASCKPFSVSGRRDEQLRTLADELRQRGAGDDCYLLAQHSELDTVRLPVEAALDRSIDDGCAVLICGGGSLALHLPEMPATPFLLISR